MSNVFLVLMFRFPQVCILHISFPRLFLSMSSKNVYYYERSASSCHHCLLTKSGLSGSSYSAFHYRVRTHYEVDNIRDHICLSVQQITMFELILGLLFLCLFKQSLT